MLYPNDPLNYLKGRFILQPNSLDFDVGSRPGMGLFGEQPRGGEDRTPGANYDDIRRQNRDAYTRPRPTARDAGPQRPQ